MRYKENNVVIWCTCPYILSDLIPNIINQKKANFCIYTSDQFYTDFENYGVKSENLEVKKSSDFSGSIFQKFFHNIFLFLFLSKEMSYLWSKDRRKALEKRLIYKFIFSINLKIEPAKLRNFYTSLMRILPGPRFKNTNIYIYNPCRAHYLFVDKTCTSYLVFDSWDHPFKFPVLFDPKITYCWNRSIKKTIGSLNGLSNIKVVDTQRIRFLDERVDSLNSRKWVYAMSYSNTDSAKHFNFEVSIIKKLAIFCAKNGKSLHVKLKPISDSVDTSVISAVDNVIADLPFERNILGSDQYHREKNKYLSQMEICFGLTTTFLLEACKAGVPIFLLNSHTSQNKILCELSNNDQVRYYVLPLFKEELETVISSDDPIDAIYSMHVEQVFSIAKNFSCRLKHWFSDGVSNETFPLVRCSDGNRR